MCPSYKYKKALVPKNKGFGAGEETRTPTAVATRTSNVLVYHSNTPALLDSSFIIALSKQFVNWFFENISRTSDDFCGCRQKGITACFALCLKEME